MAHLGCISNSEAALDCFFFFFLPYDPIPFPISLAHDRASGWICYVIPFKKKRLEFLSVISRDSTASVTDQRCDAKWSEAAFNDTF